MMSPVYFKRRFLFGFAAMMSFTITKNKSGPNTVTCGTPLLMSTNFVDTSSTTTLCFRLLKKFIIQLITYSMFYDPNLLHTISCETESKALLKSKEYTLAKSASVSSHPK